LKRSKEHIIWVKSALLAMLLIWCGNVFAQDIHFTNFNLLPIQQNPSMAGNFDGDYRFAGIYRNQWATVAVPFNTLGFSFDMNALESKKFNSRLGTGLYTYFDQAGDSRFQTLYAKIPISYSISSPLSGGMSLNYGAGIYLGIFRKSLRTDALTFDNQFTGEVFDPNIAPNEDLMQLNFLKPDLGMGFHVSVSNENDLDVGFGFAIHHLNKIEESFLNDGMKVRLNQRFNLPIFARIPIGNVWELQLDYLYQNMASKHENIMGAIVNYYFVKDGPVKKSFGFGSYYRAGDAVSAVFRYRVNNFTAGLGYDINISDFTAATNTYGGVEIGAVYIIKKVKNPTIKNKTKCLVF
jgi:type IX secretion system PorP/SprF family membrane protein